MEKFNEGDIAHWNEQASMSLYEVAIAPIALAGEECEECVEPDQPAMASSALGETVIDWPYDLELDTNRDGVVNILDRHLLTQGIATQMAERGEELTIRGEVVRTDMRAVMLKEGVLTTMPAALVRQLGLNQVAAGQVAGDNGGRIGPPDSTEI